MTLLHLLVENLKMRKCCQELVLILGTLNLDFSMSIIYFENKNLEQKYIGNYFKKGVCNRPLYVTIGTMYICLHMCYDCSVCCNGSHAPQVLTLGLRKCYK